MTGFAAHQAEGLGFACRYGEENRFKDSLAHPSGRDGEGRLRAASKRDWGVSRSWEGDLVLSARMSLGLVGGGRINVFSAGTGPLSVENEPQAGSMVVIGDLGKGHVKPWEGGRLTRVAFLIPWCPI